MPLTPPKQHCADTPENGLRFSCPCQLSLVPALRCALHAAPSTQAAAGAAFRAVTLSALPQFPANTSNNCAMPCRAVLCYAVLSASPCPSC